MCLTRCCGLYFFFYHREEKTLQFELKASYEIPDVQHLWSRRVEPFCRVTRHTKEE